MEYQRRDPRLVGVEIYDNAGNRTNRAFSVTLVKN